MRFRLLKLYEKWTNIIPISRKKNMQEISIKYKKYYISLRNLLIYIVISEE